MFFRTPGDGSIQACGYLELPVTFALMLAVRTVSNSSDWLLNVKIWGGIDNVHQAPHSRLLTQGQEPGCFGA